MIATPVVCRGHRDEDTRGVHLEDYDDEVRKVINIFSYSKKLASVALNVLIVSHTLRLEADRLHYSSFSLSPTGSVLIGKGKVPLPFDRYQLRSLTLFFNGGSISQSNTQTFAALVSAIPHIEKCFPKLWYLKIDIEWDTDETQERFGPLYTVFHDRGEADIGDLPLASIRGAHKTCRNFFSLVRELYTFRRNNECEVRILSNGIQAILCGQWSFDIEAAADLFPDSHAWREFGFRDWMQDYTMDHYASNDRKDDCLFEEIDAEPIAIEMLHREKDDHKPSEKYDTTWTLHGALTWAADYPEIVARRKAELAQRKADREAEVLF